MARPLSWSPALPGTTAYSLGPSFLGPKPPWQLALPLSLSGLDH